MLNQILPDEATTQGVNPFTVGHTVMPETEEVSVLLVPAECSPVEGVNLLVMDTPGLFAPNVRSVHPPGVEPRLHLPAPHARAALHFVLVSAHKCSTPS